MNNEEKILLILTQMQEEQKKTNERIDAVQTEINQRLTGLESDFKELRADVKSLWSQTQENTNVLSTMQADVKSLQTQTQENTDLLCAVLHNQEVANAEIESLKATTASTDGLNRLENKFDVLNKRLFEQEAEIQGLKRIK